MANVLCPLPDRDFDVTEVAVPWKLLTDAGHRVTFATEKGGELPACDPLLLTGVLFGQLGAAEEPKRFYEALQSDRAYTSPLSWEMLDVESFAALLLPGGHAPGMKQYLGSEALQRLIVRFWATKKPVAAICHELNTPLGTIVLAGKDLLHVGRELGLTDVEQLARTVTEDAQRAADIIGLMRGYVAPGERRETLAIGPFIERYATQELDRLGFRGERHIHTQDVGPGLNLVVLRAALSQVMTNILANAVEAMAGALTPRIEVRVSERDREVEVSIRDNGPGVSPDVIQRLGEPFQTTKRDVGGTGLGLYVSTLLAERMGAVLQLESERGKGTRVTLALQKALAWQPIDVLQPRPDAQD